MHNNDEWLKVGWVSDAHGLKGELYIALSAEVADWLDQFTEFRLERENLQSARFEVLAARAHKKGLIVAADGILDRTAAEKLKGATFAIPKSYLHSEPGERLYLKELMKMEVFDPQVGRLGEVIGFGSNGPQDLLVVSNSKGRFEIPLVDEFIVEIDLFHKRIVLDIPDGLVEVDHAN